MIRARFYLRLKDCGKDYCPIKWPIKYPLVYRPIKRLLFHCRLCGQRGADYGIMAGGLLHRTDGSGQNRVYKPVPKAGMV